MCQFHSFKPALCRILRSKEPSQQFKISAVQLFGDGSAIRLGHDLIVAVDVREWLVLNVQVRLIGYVARVHHLEPNIVVPVRLVVIGDQRREVIRFFELIGPLFDDIGALLGAQFIL